MLRPSDRAPGLLVGEGVVLPPTVELGGNIVIHEGTVIGGEARIQDGAVVGKPVALGPRSSASRDPVPPAEGGDGAIVCAGAVSGAGATVGAGAVVGDQAHVRERAVVGASRMATFDDMELERKLMVYDKGFDEDFSSYGEYIARSGDGWSPRVGNDEPLRVECRHFVECIRDGVAPRSDGESGLRVVRVLEALQRSLDERRRAPVV